MEVHRVFFPHATWDNVLANIQNANLVVYMGHGYGWPSPYTRTSDREPPGRHGPQLVRRQRPESVHVLRRDALRECIHLAPNAIVYLNHLCYASGNGEPGMAIPGRWTSRSERVDNMASGWLAIGARAVFAYGWWQKLNLPNSADDHRSDDGPDVHDPRPSGAVRGSPGGIYRLERVALRLGADARGDDPPRSTSKDTATTARVTGDLSMTAADFRSTATGTPGRRQRCRRGRPRSPSLSAAGSTTATGVVAGSPCRSIPTVTASTTPLVLTHTVTRAAYLDATVTNVARVDGAQLLGVVDNGHHDVDVERQERRRRDRAGRSLHAHLRAAR